MHDLRLWIQDTAGGHSPGTHMGPVLSRASRKGQEHRLGMSLFPQPASQMSLEDIASNGPRSRNGHAD